VRDIKGTERFFFFFFFRPGRTHSVGIFLWPQALFQQAFFILTLSVDGCRDSNRLHFTLKWCFSIQIRSELDCK
jgi:hypothetical protein